MTPEQYAERVRAQLDALHSPQKDRILLGLIRQLYPNGDPDHPVSGADFVAEAVRLLTPFHPDQLRLAEGGSAPRDDSDAPAF